MTKRGKRHFLRTSLTEAPPNIEARVFLQDPEVATTSGVGLTTIELPGEAWLGAGPTSARFAVVDRDDSERRTHPGVKVLSDGTGFDVGRGKPRTNTSFHQVNVWATVARLLAHLESPKLFGRKIPWAFSNSRLELRPHAEVLENAYYDRETGSIRFGHFEIDGKRVYTCLSHDVIAHEFGHAVLDGLKPLYYENEGPDPAAFHEFFGDAVAMASALTMQDLIAKLLRHKSASIDDSLKPLHWITDLMEEWGAAYGDRFIRTARNRLTMADLRRNYEEHDRSLVLSGASYDIFRGIYAKLRSKTSDASAVNRAADHTSRLIFRAIDYCPPAGLDFATYARAILRADEVAYPVDDGGYRDIVASVLKKRGILPRRNGPSNRIRILQNDALRPYDVERLAASETDAYIFLDRNRETLGIPRTKDFQVTRVYQTRKTAAGGYYPPREIIIEFVWCEKVRLRGRSLGEYDGALHDLWCGGTLILDAEGNVLHFVLAASDENRRMLLHRYVRYLVQMENEEAEAAGEAEDSAAGLAASPRVRTAIDPDGTLRIKRNPAARCAIRRGRRPIR